VAACAAGLLAGPWVGLAVGGFLTWLAVGYDGLPLGSIGISMLVAPFPARQSLEEIADLCGFASANRQLETTPGEYRSRFRSSGITKSQGNRRNAKK